ncbi:hypothetical protein SUGI_0705610 [Cryptomeria japonica]|nr:hypothetical protein SUGI_0705610 [Cryptomeria japonica]
MQPHILPLSNLDLLIPPVSVHVFFCYKNPFPRTFASALSHLKTSLSRVLGKLVPLLSEPFQEEGTPVFAVQVIEFSCGGSVVGCTFDLELQMHTLQTCFSEAGQSFRERTQLYLRIQALHAPYYALEIPLLTVLKLRIFLVSSGLRFPLYEIDYGWGKPTFGSYHFPWGGEAGYVMPTHSPAGNDSWIVYLHLPPEHLNAIEADPNRILLPMTQDFLHLA